MQSSYVHLAHSTHICESWVSDIKVVGVTSAETKKPFKADSLAINLEDNIQKCNQFIDLGDAPALSTVHTVITFGLKGPFSLLDNYTLFRSVIWKGRPWQKLGYVILLA